MLNKNLKYYRLKNNLSKKELASLCGVTPMAITYYESGARNPNIDTIKVLAAALGTKVTDFLAVRNENLVFRHEEFRKNSKLTLSQQEYVIESVEEYFGRFFTIVELLGGEVLPTPPKCYQLHLSNDDEENALNMRRHLKFADFGPIENLIASLENKGILVYLLEIENDNFSGMNGFINNRPYIVVNSKMSPERNRSTITHELAHLMFKWPEDKEDSKIELQATTISGCFLLSKIDAKRELGERRKAITKDMILVCKEYGVSMMHLVKRAELSGIINSYIAKDFFIQASINGWRKNEPIRINEEKPQLFEQLVFRAVSENEISIQKGAELLHMPFSEVESHCFFEG